jgi:hypothetical protein
MHNNIAGLETSYSFRWDSLSGYFSQQCESNHHRLLWTCKCYVWCLLNPVKGHGAGKVSYVISTFINFRRFLNWMLVEGYGSFSQLDADAFRRFHEHVLGLSLSDSTKTHILQAVLYLWRERDRMPEGERLTIVPWNNRSSYRLLGRWAVKKAYEPVDEKLALQILAHAHEWVINRSSDILDISTHARQLWKQSEDPLSPSAFKPLRIYLRDTPFSVMPGAHEPWRSPVRGMRDLHQLENLLQAACFIVIAGMVGPRIHELLSLRPGCVDGPVRVADGGLEVYYLRGRTSKISPAYEGHERSWLCAARPVGSNSQPAVVVAAEVLERLHEIYDGGHEPLFRDTRFGHRLSQGAMTDRMNQFISIVPGMVAKSRVTTHRWRKTYVRFVARRDTTHLNAVSQQLGHVSLAMTLAYAGNDLDLSRLIGEERAVDLAETLMEIVKSPSLAGQCGEQAREPLARFYAQFKEQEEFIRWVTQTAKQTNIGLYPSAWGVCYYRQQGSECGGSRLAPNYARRSPDTCLGCANLIVAEKHRLWYEDQEREYSALLKRHPIAPDILTSQWKQRLSAMREVLAQLGPGVATS